MNSIVIILLALCLLLVGLGVFMYVFYKKHKDETPKSQKKNKRNTKERKKFLQSLYKHTPFIKGLYSKTFNRMSAIKPSNVVQLGDETTSLISKALLCALLVTAYGIATSKGNPVYIIAHIGVSYVVSTLYLDTVMEKKERDLLKSFREVLPKINKAYDKHKVVSDSIYDVFLSITDDNSFTTGRFKKKKLSSSKNAIIGYHLERLYKVLSAPASKIDVETQKFIVSSPNTYITLLLSTCLHIQKKGDKGLREKTGSSFKKQINQLQELVNDDVINTENLYNKMKSLPFLTLVLSIPLIKPLELFCYSVMPDLKAKNFFSGAYGLLLVSVVLVVTFFMYGYIMKIKNPNDTVYKVSDSKIMAKLTKIANPYISAYQNKHYSKTEKLSRKLKKAGARTSTKQFLLKKVLFAFGGFLVALVLFASGVIIEKVNAIPNYTQSFEQSLLPNDEYRILMREVSKDMALIVDKKPSDVQTITEMVMQDGRIKNRDNAEQIANEIIKKNDKYNSTYFRWYYILLSMIIGFISFYLPDFYLSKELQMAEIMKADEVNQFRSIISLLMETGGVTVDTVLHDMQKFARYYKEPISKCLLNIGRNERKALLELKSSEKNDEAFCDIVDGLLNMHVTGLSKSFESIRAEKDFHRENRRSEIARINEDKISKANLCWQVPFYTTIIFTMFIPIGTALVEVLLTTGIGF